jgi:hypothetical protein
MFTIAGQASDTGWLQRYMVTQNGFRTGQVGDGAGDFKDAVIPDTGEFDFRYIKHFGLGSLNCLTQERVLLEQK